MEIFTVAVLLVMLGVTISLSLMIDAKNKTISNLKNDILSKQYILNDTKRQLDNLFQQNKELGDKLYINQKEYATELTNFKKLYDDLKFEFEKVYKPVDEFTSDKSIANDKVTFPKSRKKKVSDSTK
jgi:esterase/lipase